VCVGGGGWGGGRGAGDDRGREAAGSSGKTAGSQEDVCGDHLHNIHDHTTLHYTCESKLTEGADDPHVFCQLACLRL
jgi:hypothetical protein